ncbi:hypothetical protein [Duganella sp. HH101]|uniref:hypothetical protein n=1 Tax=Duganella sp. HH101 TaxID=1781066 RepID=UPI0008753730|nr:hypothetical protein [Duganella sp. HH101]OFA04824.1 hypothetical protein DUGA2_15670 [Duganella sp. HH101]
MPVWNIHFTESGGGQPPYPYHSDTEPSIEHAKLAYARHRFPEQLEAMLTEKDGVPITTKIDALLKSHGIDVTRVSLFDSGPLG